MQKQFQYIIDLARKYKSYSDDKAVLLDALNNLEVEQIRHIYEDYGDPEKRFQPVNLLRAETARLLSDGRTITENEIEEIKVHIRNKNMDYFSHLSSKYIDQFKDYSYGKRDIFANWKNLWSVFHTFFYRNGLGNEKDNVQNYLEQIAVDLLEQLSLPEYTYHTVDFQGANNFGSENCWLALYPEVKNSHKDSYQFFILLSAMPEAGMVTGWSIKGGEKDRLVSVGSYDDVISQFEKLKTEILKLNNGLRNYFKYAPGSQAVRWDEYYSQGIAAINYNSLNVKDISGISSKQELNLAAGLTENDRSNKTMNLWLFKSANIGDLVFASKGVNTCLGIGIIEGDYYYEDGDAEYCHQRKVNWITDKVYQYKNDSAQNRKHKTLFRRDTFSTTNMWDFILSEYVRLYPELSEVFDEHNLKYNAPVSDAVSYSEVEDGASEAAEGEVETVNYWWLNANPSIWSINSHNEGELQTYTTYNERGNKRRIYRHFEAVKPGDYMIGYESSPTKQIKAMYQITKGIHKSKKGEEEVEFELLEKYSIPVRWSELKNNPGLKKCEVFINNQGSLFKLTDDEFDIIQEIIDSKNISTERMLESGSVPKYSIEKDEDKPFFNKEEFFRTIELLKIKKNIILQGPPGVGKTFMARKIAYQIMGVENDAQIEMVQFHQSYSYEDFIQGLRPSQQGGFELRDGVFYSFCKRAESNHDKSFFFIIDEINRGNLSKIFGELMMLIEADKRNKRYALKLTYAEDENDRFFVPENLHIIGTMNTADRSLAIVDYALRRRFAFITLQPEFGDGFKNFLLDRKLSPKIIDHISNSIRKVNKTIKSDINLGDGFQIGHSYFCGNGSDMDEEKWFENIVSFEIKPLLEEIWFDDLEQVDKMINTLKR